MIKFYFKITKQFPNIIYMKIAGLVNFSKSLFFPFQCFEMAAFPNEIIDLWSLCFSYVNQIWSKKNISFLFFRVTRFFFFLFNIFFFKVFFLLSFFCDNVVGKNARKLLMIFLNDEFIFWGVFFPSFFSFFRFHLFFYKK